MITPRYLAYIDSTHWKKKRQQAFAYHGKRCFACGTGRNPLHVHHLTYDRFGHELMTDLMILCQSCHREVTKIYKRNRRRGLRRVTMEFVKMKQANR